MIPRAPDSGGARALGELAAVAHALLYPLEGFAGVRPLGAIAGPAVVNAARHRAFRRPLNRLAASDLGLTEFAVSPAAIARAAHDGAARVVVRLVVDDRAVVEGAALLVAAVASTRRLLPLALKSDRAWAATVYGPEAVGVATREGAVLYGRIAALGDDGPLDTAREPTAARLAALAEGVGIIARFAEAVDGGLARLVRMRFGRTGAGDALPAPVNAQIVRLLQQGVPSWSAPIV